MPPPSTGYGPARPPLWCKETAILRSSAGPSILLLAAVAMVAFIPGPARACGCLSPTITAVEHVARAEERRPREKAADLMRQMRRVFKPSSNS